MKIIGTSSVQPLSYDLKGYVGAIHYKTWYQVFK